METIKRKSELGSKEQPQPETINTLRHGLLQGLLKATASVGLLVILAATYSAIIQDMFWALPIYWISYAGVVVSLVWRDAPFTLKAWLITLSFFNLGIVNYIPDGLNGVSFAFHVVTIFLAGILLEKRGGQIALAATTITTITMGVLYTTNVLNPPNEISSNMLEWIIAGGVFLMVGVLINTSNQYLLPRLSTALTQSHQLTNELKEYQSALEKTVEERTAFLKKRNEQLEAATYVAREAVRVQTVESLLKKTVDLISERFGFYHAGIFLLDDAKKYAILRAASSEGGKRMLAGGHRLRVGETSIVGYVTRHGEPRISLDVGKDAVFFDNPDLPKTRSEMALPLSTHNQIIGALDVQSTKPEAFTNEDVATLETLADQIALAIHNTRLFQESQESLKAAQLAYGEASREAWEGFLTSQPNLKERYDPLGILPPPDQWSKEMKLAAKQGKIISNTPKTLAIPLKVRGQVVGIINAHKPKDAPSWTEEETNLMETLSDQLSIALDSARSYQETQRRATREHLTGEATARMRETLDLETVLSTAVSEFSKALNGAAVDIQLDIEDNE